MPAQLPRPPRRRLDPAARLAAIMDAAGAAFAEAPYSEVSLASIAAAAGASEALVHKYVDTKPALYAAVVAENLERLTGRLVAADRALPAPSSARDRVQTALLVYVDEVAAQPGAWAAALVQPGSEPSQAQGVRRDARAQHVALLADVLGPRVGVRAEFALWGTFGFLDGACARWVSAGCPDAERWPLVEAALGALEGALGDWGR